MQNSWIVLLPPVIVLVLAFTTHRIVFALLTGILSATLILHDFSPIQALTTAAKRIWETTELGNLTAFNTFWESSNLLICIFLLFIGVIIMLIKSSGGTYAYADYIEKKARNARSIEMATILLSLLLFIDEYLNIVTVGSVMHTLTDRFKIPRAKLALLVNAIAAPLCIMIPFSSWGAFIMVQLKNSGYAAHATSNTLIATAPFSTFLHTIPFVFYSLIMIIVTIIAVRKQLKLPIVHIHEAIAKKTGNLFGGKPERETKEEAVSTQPHAIIDFLFPVILMVGLVMGFLPVFNYNAANALFVGGTLTLITTILFYAVRKRMTFSKFPAICSDGIQLMIDAIIVIILAWTLSGILKDDLLAGQFLASKLIGTIPVFAIPALLFIASTITALAVGSSWGAMAIMIPIATPLLLSMLNISTPATLASVPLLLPCLGAVLSGSVSGVHLSPFSDIAILSSSSTRAYHIDFVKAQQLYAMPFILATTGAFIITALLQHLHVFLNLGISIGSGIAIALIYLALFQRSA